MLENLLGGILGNTGGDEGRKEGGLGSLLVIGIIVFVLLGGMKLFRPKEECDPYCE